MLRWFLVIVVAVAGAAWLWQDDLWPEGGGQASSVLLERPAQARSGEVELPRLPVAPKNEPKLAAVKSAADRPAAKAVLVEARSLVLAGQPGLAADLLRRRLRQPGSPGPMGQLAWELAKMSDGGGERRGLVARAFRAGAVSGSAYAEAGEMLMVMNRNPRLGLLDSISTQIYQVKSGDNLWTICNKTLKTLEGGHHEPGLLRLLNGMSSDSLRAGQSLMVPDHGLRIEIDRNGHGLVAWLEDVPVLAYEVGLGREGRTPSGEFVVEVKQENPTWFVDGRAIPFGEPENILGTRWMGFENQPGVMGYGIHGTEFPESVGLDESGGCVRMRNPEVEQLFEIVARGTKVTIP